MALKDRTRRPTGAVPWPLLLIEGPEKTGKTYTSVLLSKSPKVGQMYWIDFGEGSADEYGAIPGVNYEIVRHDGSWADIYQAVTDVYEEAQRVAAAKEKPVVLLIDGMNAEWDLHKNWAGARARSTQSNREKLQRDPDAEIKVPQNCWNDANARHRQLMWMLMRFPGIAIMTARGKVVSAVDDNGRPIEGKKDYRVEGQKDLGFDATAWIRLYRDKPAIVVGARSVHLGIRAGKDEPYRLGKDWTLEEVVFDLLKCDPATARVRDFVELVPDLTPESVYEEALKPETGFDRIKELYAYTHFHFPGVTMSGADGSEETLLAVLKRAGDARRASAGQRQQARPVAAQPAAGTMARARQEAAAAGIDPDEESRWCRDFMARLAESATADDFAIRRAEIDSAADREITPTAAEDMRGEVDVREHPDPAQEPGTARPAAA